MDYIWGLCCQNQVSQAGISNCIPKLAAGCDYLSLPEIPASDNKFLICNACAVINKLAFSSGHMYSYYAQQASCIFGRRILLFGHSFEGSGNKAKPQLKLWHRWFLVHPGNQASYCCIMFLPQSLMPSSPSQPGLSVLFNFPGNPPNFLPFNFARKAYVRGESFGW